jgi:hypothetical protein
VTAPWQTSLHGVHEVPGCEICGLRQEAKYAMLHINEINRATMASHASSASKADRQCMFCLPCSFCHAIVRHNSVGYV